ncbi:DUF3307 domain-containing protein [Virgibacillus flavescens]|uniref:DUF3307 domain-containing protein n=1 Tax=Virgibacillus flavescens TaxID=1611422 RepID=UPI003D337915
MSLFNVLLIGHFVGDFLFQTNWMATYKSQRWLPLLVHSSLYTIVIILFSLLEGGLSGFGILLIFIGHLILDRGTFVTFWVVNIQTATKPNQRWLSIITDQTFHIILLAIAIYLS